MEQQLTRKAQELEQLRRELGAGNASQQQQQQQDIVLRTLPAKRAAEAVQVSAHCSEGSTYQDQEQAPKGKDAMMRPCAAI